MANITNDVVLSVGTRLSGTSLSLLISCFGPVIIHNTQKQKKVYVRGIIRVNRCCEPYFSQGTIPGQTVMMNSTSSSQETFLAIFTYTNNKRVMFIKCLYIRVC